MHYCPIIGGQEVYIKNLMAGLAKHGIVSSVLQPKKDCRESNVFFTPRFPQKILGKFIENFPWFAFNIGLFFSKKILRQYDILICHYAFHYPSVRWHKKIIILSHGVLWKIPPRSYFDKYHQRAAMRAKKEGAFIIANDTHFLRELGFSIQPGKGFFKEVFENVWVIPNCTDTEYFVKTPEIKKEKMILVPRNIREDRGIHLALEAFNIFSKEHPDFMLTIVGKGMNTKKNTGYAAYCEGLVKKFGLEKRVQFAGHAEWEQMLNYYNRAMITLVPSIEKEGTSLSALESMSCGTATVVTNVAGLQDLPAIKAEPTPTAIAQQLVFTLENIDKISSQQQNTVRAGFNIRLWTDAWVRVIETINRRN